MFRIVFSILSLWLVLAGWLMPPAGWAVLSDSQVFITDIDETLSVSGVISRNQLIWIKPGSTLNVNPADNQVTFGQLQLIAPQVIIEGTVNAEGTGFSNKGQGKTATSKWSGGGGGGYGNTGGNGAFNKDSGGLPYDTPYLAEAGSPGGGAVISAQAGRGGGSIRIDALALTLTATARLLAAGSQKRDSGVGGGSGGGILLNSAVTWLSDGCVLDVSGGPGGPANANLKPGAGGGGSGGRIKLLDYQAITNAGALLRFSGGSAGNSTASDGLPGTWLQQPAPEPNQPVLLSPLDGQTDVGELPTYLFQTADPGFSQFLYYRLVIAENDSLQPELFSASQLTSSTGWSKPYYSSNEQASYTPSVNLKNNTMYFWKIFVTSNRGQTWVASATHHFYTAEASNPRPLEPHLIQPEDQQSMVSKTPVFQILGTDPQQDVLHFTLILSQNADLTNPRFFESSYPGWDQSSYPTAGAYAGVTATCRILNTPVNPDALLPGMAYYWKAIVYDLSQQSAGSPIYHFQTVPLPETPEILSPADETVFTSMSLRMELLANSPTGGSLAYKVELSADEFQTVQLFRSTQGEGWTQGSYASGETAVLIIPEDAGLAPGETYRWHAMVYDLANDNWSRVSKDYSFTIRTPPLLPRLLSPEDQAEIPGAPVTFQFSVASDAGATLSGRIEISTDQFQTTLHTFDQTVDPSGWSQPEYASNQIMAFTPPANVSLTRGQIYWWRAQGTDGLSWGPSSVVRNFTLSNQLSIQRVQTAPNPAVGVQEIKIRFQSSTDANLVLRFFNQSGQLLDTLSLPARGGPQGNVIDYDISRFASGVYYYHIEARSAFGTQQTTKRFAVVK